MSAKYAPRLIVCTAEPPLGVAFLRCGVRDDGTPDAPQHFNHAEGGWDSAFDPAKHLRPLSTVWGDRPNIQGFAVPRAVLDDEQALATLHVVAAAGGIASDYAELTGAQLRAQLNGWGTTP